MTESSRALLRGGQPQGRRRDKSGHDWLKGGFLSATVTLAVGWYVAPSRAAQQGGVDPPNAATLPSPAQPDRLCLVRKDPQWSVWWRQKSVYGEHTRNGLLPVAHLAHLPRPTIEGAANA